MRVKYEHRDNDCLIYDTIIQCDNIVISIQSYYGAWGDDSPNINTSICKTNAEARRIFFHLCEQHSKQNHISLYYSEGE